MNPFHKTFGERDDRVLIIKVGGVIGNEDSLSILTQKIGHASDIHRCTDVLDSVDMDSLIVSVDGVLSLYRSEGFGLFPAQKMLAGKVVVATDWPGPSDFSTQENAIPIPATLIAVNNPQRRYLNDGDQKWAEPDIDVTFRALILFSYNSKYRMHLQENSSIWRRFFL